jgi:hypothetical protein
MDLNVKLELEEMAKLRAEMECFATQEAVVTKRLDKVVADEHLHDARITNLEETDMVLDKSFAKWRPVVDSSISAVKLELSKLNSFFDHDARAPRSSSLGVLNTGSTSTHPPAGLAADDPALKSTTGIVGLGMFTPIPMTWSRVQCFLLPHQILLTMILLWVLITDSMVDLGLQWENCLK